MIVLEDTSSWEIIYLNDLSNDNNSIVTDTEHSGNDSLLQPLNIQTGIYPCCSLTVEASSSVNLNLLASLLYSYPITSRAQFLIRGFLVGFDIGFRNTFTETHPCNLLSTSLNPPGVTEAIIKKFDDAIKMLAKVGRNCALG